MNDTVDHKGSVRERVFRELRRVARPDSRFHFDFAEFIADFEGSDAATARLKAHRVYAPSKVLFITPDNCLEQLRFEALCEGKQVLITTYSIRRGFWLLDPATIPADRLLYAATLDGMERHATPLTLAQIRERLPRIDWMITGTGAINEDGVRFGKGHGFFDAEWGMLHARGRAGARLPGAARDAVSGGVRHGGRHHLHADPHDRGPESAQAYLRHRLGPARSAHVRDHPAAAGAQGDGARPAAAPLRRRR
jgi:5-formyltetrahydrofolate cyclo-ligase